MADTPTGRWVVYALGVFVLVAGGGIFYGVRSSRPELQQVEPDADEPLRLERPANPGSPTRALVRSGGGGSATPKPARGAPAGAGERRGPAMRPEQRRAAGIDGARSGNGDDDVVEDDVDPAPEPTAPAQRPPPTGSLSKEAVMAGVRAAIPQIRKCFNDALQSDPSLAGRVVLDFDIEAKEGEGVVTRGEVKEESETRSPFFEACVLQKVAQTKFDAPKGDGRVRVSYPLQFDPGGGFGGEPPPDDDEAAGEEDAP